MAISYKGIAGLTLVPTTDNTIAYVYAGAPVPGNAEPKRLKELVEEGFLGKLGEEEDPSSGGQTGGPSLPIEVVQPAVNPVAPVVPATPAPKK